MRRTIALTLILCMMLGLGNYFPGPSFALNESIYTTYKESIESKYSEAERQDFKVRIDDLSEYKGRNEKQGNTLYTSDITIEQILYYLIEFKGTSKRPLENEKQRLNPYIYKKYKVIAYDDLNIIENNRAGHGSYERVDAVDGTELEYRYLGYTKEGTKITNDFYPADFKSGTNPLTRTYNTTAKATGSWDKYLNEGPHFGQIYQLLNTNLKNDDTTDGTYRPVGYTTFDLLGLNSFPGLSGYLGNNNLRSAFGKVIKMQEPSLGVSGQFKLVHGTNKSYYDTFRTEEMTLHADVTIYPSESVYFIAENQDQVTIEYEVRTIIDNDKTNLPYSNGLNISEVKINSEGNEAEVFSNPSYSDKNLERVLSSTFTKTVKVNHLDLSDGQDTVTIDASSSYKDMTGYNVNFNASPVQVKVNAQSDFLADFTIHNSESDNVTDAHISVPSFTFTQPENVTLIDASATSKGNIISRTWYVLKNGSYDPISTSNETGLVFTVNAGNRVDVLNSNRLSFKLEVQTDLSLEKEVAIHEVTFRKSAAPQPVPSGPVAIIAAKLETNSSGDYIAMEGEVFDIHGRNSYHPEGVKLESYAFNTNGGKTSSTGSKKNDYIYYLESAKYHPELTVTDANGGTDSDSTMIRVRPAEFIPVISVDGTLKENRKVSISVENEHGLRYYPIYESSLDWTITPLDGQGSAVEIDGGADGHKSFDLLFNKKGRYQVSVEGDIYNGIKHRSGTATQIITIAEDLPPVVDFSVSSKLVRDVNNDNLTEIIVFDKSYSPDGDIISQRKVWWRYDDDNDGDFGDIDWTLASAGNAITTSMFTKDVGQYEIKEEIKEQFGQTTIAKFIVDADYKRSNSDNKTDDEKRVEIINIAPTVTLDVANKKTVNLVVYHDYDEAALENLNSKLEILKAQLLGKKIDLKINYLSPEIAVGTKTINKVNFDTYLYFNVYVRGEYESGTGRKSNVRGTKTIKIFLDSFSTNGEIPTQSNEDRFELVSVTHNENAGASHSLEDSDGRDEEDWWDTDRFIIRYKDRGVLKQIYYDFSKEHSTWNDRASQSQSYDIDEVRLQSSGIVVDEPSFGSRSYNKANQAPVMDDGWLKWYTKGTSYERNVTLKKYNEASLDSILMDIGKDDAFFINMARKEENRLALSESLLDKLKEKNIHYKTLSEDALLTNPLSGRYDEVYLSNDVYLTIGNLIYQVLDGKYILRGTLNQLKDIVKTKTFKEKFTIKHWSDYSFGGKFYTGGSAYIMKYGLEILNYKLVDSNNDYDNVYSSSDSDDRSRLFNDPNYAKQVMGNNPPLWVEKDGNLVGYKMYLREDNYSDRYWSKRREEWVYSYTYIISKHTSAHILGSGYVNVLQGLTTMDDGFQMRGYVHSNGMIYFKKPSYSRHGISWSNYMTIVEGTSNIDHIYYNEFQKSYYVFTKNKTLIKYDIINKKRTVLLTTYLERKGRSAKVDEDTVMVDGKLYEGYKEVYSDDASAIGNTYYPYRYTVTYMLDLEGNYTAVKKYYANRSQSEPTSEKTYILGKNVAYLPYRQHSYDDIWPLDLYVGQDDYMYKANNLNQMRSYNTPTDFVAVKYPWNGKKIRSTQYLSHTISEGVQNLTWFEDGSLDLDDQNLMYANLTTGSKGDVVGDSMLISLSPMSGLYDETEKLIDSIYDAFENYSSTNSVYVLLGDTIETTLTADDYENDEILDSSYDFIHVNPNYYENSLGADPTAGTGLSKPVTTLKYVGHYVVNPKAKDNPKDDDRFDEYRLENNDEATTNVYVHRKPFARMNFRFGESPTYPGYFSVTCTDSGSYDLDHESEAEKGIVEQRFAIIAEDDGEWTRINGKTFTHNKIIPGKQYKIAYTVVDKEGASSDPVIEEFQLEEVPINLNAKIKAKDNQFNISSMPITEFFSIYDIETEYSRELKLEIGLYDGDELKGILISVPFNEGVSAITDSSNPNFISWNIRNLQVLMTLADKDYKLRVTAIDVANPSKRKVVEFDVTVRTPINLFPEVTPEELLTEEAYTLKAFTSKYVDVLKVKAFKDTVNETELTMPLDGEVIANMKKWLKKETVPQMDEGDYTFEFTATTPNGNTETAQVIKTVQNVKLFDFNVFQVSDYDLKSLFESGGKYFVKDLALDKFDGPLMKMGYAFYFELTSKGLKEDADRIKITPSFLDQYGRELDMYYDDEKNSYILGVTPSGGNDIRDTFKLYYSGEMKSSERLGSFSELSLPLGLKTIDSANSTEHWRGRYGLPLSTIFTLPGDDPHVSDNHVTSPITIKFKIEAIKNNKSVYDYVLSGQWEAERLNEHGNPLNSTKYTKHSPGEVIIIDPSRDGREDFEVRPVW